MPLLFYFPIVVWLGMLQVVEDQLLPSKLVHYADDPVIIPFTKVVLNTSAASQHD